MSSISELDVKALRRVSEAQQKRHVVFERQRETLAQEEREVCRRIQAKREKLEALREDQLVKDTLEQVPLVMEIAALEGKTAAEVYTLRYKDTEKSYWEKGYEPSSPSQLQGAGKRIYDALAEATKESGLSASLVQHSWDIEDLDTNCRIEVSW